MLHISVILLVLLCSNIALAGNYKSKQYVSQTYRTIDNKPIVKAINTKLDEVEKTMKPIVHDGQAKTLRQSQMPEETLTYFRGNCLDMARASQKLLNDRGITSKIIAIKTGKKGSFHAVTVFQYQGKNYCFSNNQLLTYLNNEDLITWMGGTEITEVK